MLALRSQIFEYLREVFLQTCLGVMGTGWFRKEKENKMFSSCGNALLLLTFLKARGWSEHVFTTCASPTGPQ